MSESTDIRSQWVTAVLEDRMATALYLAPYVPAADLSGLIQPPGDKRGRISWGASGEIGTLAEKPSEG